MIEVITFFLVVALVLYSLLGGADFGAGIVEIALGSRAEDEVTHALAPVWEVNHIWLILALVVTFVAFPEQHAYLVTVFHIPITLLLICIVIRGCAFTFRHYDPVAKDQGTTRNLYTWGFRSASVTAAVLIGMVASSLLSAHPVKGADTFSERYVFPWLTTEAIVCGLFVAFLFSLVATTFLAAEGSHPDKQLRYLSLGRRIQWAAVGLGLLVLIMSRETLFVWHSLPDQHQLLVWGGYASMLLSTVAIPMLAWAFHRGRAHWARVAVSAQVVGIVIGWLVLVQSMRVTFSDDTAMSVKRFAGPETQQALVFALVVGVSLIGPACAWLFKVFKSRQRGPESSHQ